MYSDLSQPGAEWAHVFAGALAAIICRTPAAALAGRNRTARHVRARRLALHLAHVGLGASLTGASAGLARHRSAARRACARIEDSRDRAAWDRALDLLERALRLWRRDVSRSIAECAR